MDSKKIARGGVSVVETLAKYGIKGTGTVIRCGAEATGILSKKPAASPPIFPVVRSATTSATFL